MAVAHVHRAPGANAETQTHTCTNTSHPNQARRQRPRSPGHHHTAPIPTHAYTNRAQVTDTEASPYMLIPLHKDPQALNPSTGSNTQTPRAPDALTDSTPAPQHRTGRLPHMWPWNSPCVVGRRHSPRVKQLLGGEWMKDTSSHCHNT